MIVESLEIFKGVGGSISNTNEEKAGVCFFLISVVVLRHNLLSLTLAMLVFQLTC